MAYVGVGKCTAFYPSENTYGREDNKQEVDRMTASGHQQPLSCLGTTWTWTGQPWWSRRGHEPNCMGSHSPELISILLLLNVQTCQQQRQILSSQYGTSSPDQLGVKLITLDSFHPGKCSNLSRLKSTQIPNMGLPFLPALFSTGLQNLWPTDLGSHITLKGTKWHT